MTETPGVHVVRNPDHAVTTHANGKVVCSRCDYTGPLAALRAATELTSGWERFWTPGRGEPATEALARIVKCPACRALVEDRDAMMHEMRCSK